MLFTTCDVTTTVFYELWYIKDAFSAWSGISVLFWGSAYPNNQ